MLSVQSSEEGKHDSIKDALEKYISIYAHESCSTNEILDFSQFLEFIISYGEEKWGIVWDFSDRIPEKSSLGGGNTPENGGEVEHVG